MSHVRHWIASTLSTNRIRRWMVTMVFALLPLLLSLLIHGLAETISIKVLMQSPEILFFSMVIPIVAWMDIGDLQKAVQDSVLQWQGIGLVLLSLVAAVLYGAFLVFTQLVEPPDSFLPNLLRLSFFIGVLSGAISTTVQVQLARLEAGKS